MDRQHILEEIRRTAKANHGIPLGWRRFEAEAAIGHYEWFGQFWSKWSDAIREAGLEPNRISEAYTDEFLVERLVLLTRSLGHIPTNSELCLATNTQVDLPSEKVFRRLGPRAQRGARILAYCAANVGYDDVATIWAQAAVQGNADTPAAEEVAAPGIVGYVYLFKHGARREYKIGRTNNALRREGELAIQLPEKIAPIHYIKTDDPGGVEAYWHSRFANKRKEGEWFQLTPQDIAAFKRWKRIY